MKNTLMRTILAAAGIIVGLYSIPAAADNFYDPPANVADYPVGGLIRSELVTDLDTATFHGKQAYRIMYRSIGVTGDAIAMTGIVIVPDTAPPAGGYDMVVWAHGTSGVGDDCAPSKYGDLWPMHVWQGTWSYGQAANSLADQGYLTVAVDYEGLGTPGIHPYLNLRSESKAIIHGAMAAMELFSGSTSGKVASVGHSQGGQATVAAGEYNTALRLAGEPHVDYVGAVSLAGLGDVEPMVDIIAQASDKNSFPYIGYFAAAAQSIDPNLDFYAFAGPIFDETQAKTLCWDDWFGLYDNDNQPHPPEDIVNPDWAQNPSLIAYMAQTKMLGTAIDAPVLLQYSTHDYSTYPLADQFVTALCATPGNVVERADYQGGNHDIILSRAWPLTLSWLEDRFAGVAVDPANNLCAANP
ncbi:hypothetical protein [Sedimenticola sp.]|uniref:hypothetical protein n=1 Tax=Sedimenticola sp. TaxID=1940285 RepID=UPI003D0C0FFD